MLVLTVMIAAKAVAAPVQLYSPANGEDSEVTRPLLFWHSVSGASAYRVFIDGAKVADVPASKLAIFDFEAPKALTVGVHSWYVEDIPEAGVPQTSDVYTFRVDRPARWPGWVIGPFERYGRDPIISPGGAHWESLNVLNPGVLYDHQEFRMLFRAQGTDLISREGYAESKDGVTFVQNSKPVIDANEPYETKYGCEDARLYKYHGRYYAFYTGNTPDQNIAECEAISPDGVHWTQLGMVQLGTKNGAVVCDPQGTPLKIGGRFVMYIGNNSLGVCTSRDLKNWGPISPINVDFPAGWADSYEPAYAIANFNPKYRKDIVLFLGGPLNGSQVNWYYYAITELLFSEKRLAVKTDQLDDCILKPTKTYDSGQFPDVVWSNSIIEHNHEWMMYFGAGDRYIGLATAPVDK
jgi:predicted GH43/DUF377 family glycosyl hydrolase